MIAGVVASQVSEPKWVEGGSSYNGAVNYIHTTTTCPADYEAVVVPWLNSNYPPENYAAGYVMRVSVLKSSFSFCYYTYWTRQ